jgi:hypothetical protein
VHYIQSSAIDIAETSKAKKEAHKINAKTGIDKYHRGLVL